MKEYTNKNPVFSDSIQIIEEGVDYNHANTVNAATKQLLANELVLKDELVCNLIYIPEFTNSSSAGGTSFKNNHYTCSIPEESVEIWNGEISLNEGGYAFPASSDSADVFVDYQIDDDIVKVNIADGAVIPDGAVVTRYYLEKKEDASRLSADIQPMISPQKHPVLNYVPYTGNGKRLNVALSDVVAPTYNTPENRENLSSGEKIQIALGKVKKWFSDLRSGAFATISNNLVTTEEGYVLDARQGKALQDSIDNLSEDMSQTVKARYVFKDLLLAADSTYTNYTIDVPIGTSEIVVFSMDGNILWMGYNYRISSGYGGFKKIFGEAEITVPWNDSNGAIHFQLDKDCNRMAVISI